MNSRLGEEQGTIGANGKRVWLYPKEVTGFFTRHRTHLAWVLMLIYLGVPWVRWHGDPIFLIDFPAQKLSLLGNNFWAKDIPLFLPLFFSFLLFVFLVTARYGRVWCGWACPQTVFLQFAFDPVEKFFEGKASKRKERDQNPWTKEWIWRKTLKHACFAVIAWWIGNTALGYFWGTDKLTFAMLHPSMENWPGLVMVLIFSGFFYANFAFFREQACIMVCPYARLQSVIPDENTSLISYDVGRGEKRGKGAGGSRVGFGDCTDCKQCVLVCPTGIDIRQGQQLECIGCARCVDACDITMEAWKKPKGLVRYASLREFQGKKPKGGPWRMLLYGALSMIMATVSITLLIRRPIVSVDAVRSGSAPYTRVGGDSILNTFILHLRNNGSPQRILKLEWSKGASGNSSWEGRTFAIPGGQSLDLPLEIRTATPDFKRGRLETEMVLVGNSTHVPFAIELAGPWGK